MSWQMAALNVLLRTIAKPHVRRTKDPVLAAARFERAARLLLRRPVPFVRRVERGGAVPMTFVRSGPVTPDRMILFLHGGAYFVGSARAYSGPLAQLSKMAGVEVCLPDYRLLQDAPFPAAVEDAVAAWDVLRARGLKPHQIVLGGDSAGGGLALALLALLLARGERPAGVFAMSPWTDLTLSGRTLATLGPRDAIIPVDKMAEAIGRYLDGANSADPRASPLFARFPDPPPVLMHVGTTEALLDDTQRMASRLRATGGTVRVRLWDRAPHVFHLGVGWIPEAREALADLAAFAQTSLDSANR